MAIHQKSRVLVVEDDEPLRRIIASNLLARGHAVRQASDASMALSALAEEQPDLLILDINLPDRTGWDVLREARLPDVSLNVVRIGRNQERSFFGLLMSALSRVRLRTSPAARCWAIPRWHRNVDMHFYAQRRSSSIDDRTSATSELTYSQSERGSPGID